MLSMRRKFLTVLALLPLMFLLMGARQGELVDPDPIAVPAGLSTKEVGNAIRMGLMGRQWIVSADRSGEIEATLRVRAHVARIALKYDTQQIEIRYLSSENLKFEEKKGKRYIHKNYASWINNVMADINLHLQRMAMEKS